ncbi:hypothetical protein [Mesorhizobium sp. B2-3-4]|uniref:hypothetical protein n=1 Tax=Mesorhizobium sp. B2-3-4 TaxID=2589959 RepID=UPI00112D226A|nr:hypothetical protein [Mesorhizobium sp. B2-3-4]TPM34221.1 hypothetical protein FJ967_22540 [Mesorhizobium sp. B2-3-4]
MSETKFRSFEKIEPSDLVRLREIALADLDSLFDRIPRLAPLKTHLLLLCLCQGSALHYAKATRGVQDFDVWAFFRKSAEVGSFPWRRISRADFGGSKFWRNPEDGERFNGRRIDMLGRSIYAAASEAPTHALCRYLQKKPTQTAVALSERPVVVISEGGDFGKVIWPGTKNEPWTGEFFATEADAVAAGRMSDRR